MKISRPDSLRKGNKIKKYKLSLPKYNWISEFRNLCKLRSFNQNSLTELEEEKAKTQQYLNFALSLIFGSR